MSGLQLNDVRLAATDARPRVVILGGGFGGLQAARNLSRSRVHVTLIDRHNHHVFQPLLYQVATGALSDAEIAAPLRTMLRRQKNVEVLMASAERIEPEHRRVILDEGAIDYDYLVVATGTGFSYFGHDDWAPHAPGLKSIEDAREMRERIFRAFEAAEREGDPSRASEWLTFVIIGAGPTGVELAGALAEITRHTLRKDFRHIDPSSSRVVLVDALPSVLPGYPEDLRGKAQTQLEELGVEVRTNFMVAALDERGVRNKDGEAIAARTTLWAAGVQASGIARSLEVELDKQGRVKVCPDLSVPGHPEIFVVGDLAHVQQDGDEVPGLAPAAMQMGKHAAKTIHDELEERAREHFRYFDKGMFAVIGRGAAVGRVGTRWHWSGFMAWMAWLFIHVYFLVGFRNRLVVLFNWAYAYLTNRRGARIVAGERQFGLVQPRPSTATKSGQRKAA